MFFSPDPIRVSSSLMTSLALLLSMRPVRVTTHTSPLRPWAILSPLVVIAVPLDILPEALGQPDTILGSGPFVVETINKLPDEMNSPPTERRRASGRNLHRRRRFAWVIGPPIIDDFDLDSAGAHGKPNHDVGNTTLRPSVFDDVAGDLVKDHLQVDDDPLGNLLLGAKAIPCVADRRQVRQIVANGELEGSDRALW